MAGWLGKSCPLSVRGNASKGRIILSAASNVARTALLGMSNKAAARETPQSRIGVGI
ncbi:unnamed protein product [Prunus armeniaca]